MNELDALLQAPLTDVADNGFTGRLMLRIEKQRLHHKAVALALWPAATLALLALCLLSGLDVSILRKLFYAFGDPTGQLSVTMARMGHIFFHPGTLVLAALLLISLRADRVWARL